jgi:vacuolar-type H+-ATPase subunit H
MTEIEEAKMRELLRATEKEIHLMFAELFEWARKTGSQTREEVIDAT